MTKKILLLIITTTLITGCGFKLRGVDDAGKLSDKFKKTYLSISDEYLESQIKRLINNSGGKVVNKKEATTKVRVSSLSSKKRQIALSGDGSLREYEQTYKISVTVSDLSNGISLGTRELSTIKFIQLDKRKVLAGEEQSDVVRKAAIRNLSKRVMSYLHAFN